VIKTVTRDKEIKVQSLKLECKEVDCIALIFLYCVLIISVSWSKWDTARATRYVWHSRVQKKVRFSVWPGQVSLEYLYPLNLLPVFAGVHQATIFVKHFTVRCWSHNWQNKLQHSFPSGGRGETEKWIRSGLRAI